MCFQLGPDKVNLDSKITFIAHLSKRIFFSATSTPVFIFLALYTIPYVPSPIYNRHWSVFKLSRRARVWIYRKNRAKSGLFWFFLQVSRKCVIGDNSMSQLTFSIFWNGRSSLWCIFQQLLAAGLIKNRENWRENWRLKNRYPAPVGKTQLRKRCAFFDSENNGLNKFVKSFSRIKRILKSY